MGMIYNLHIQGIHRLAQVSDSNTTTVWHRGCKNKQILGLTEREADHWRVYVEQLKKNNIRIIDQKDTLVLSKNPSMKFSILHLGIKKCL